MAHNKVRIAWNGQGGELESVVVNPTTGHDDRYLTTALMELIRGEIVAPGDTFTVTELED